MDLTRNTVEFSLDVPETAKPRVLLINTTGQKLVLEQTLALTHNGLPHISMEDLCRGDSECGYSHWVAVAELIALRYFEFDGFVVLDSPNNLVHTGTALSFMLMNLGRPIVFTGSIISATEVHTDLKRNLTLSLLLAASGKFNEVVIVFAEKMFRANRTTKISSISLQPFASPHFPFLAYMRGNKATIEAQRLLPAPKGRLQVQRHMDNTVGVVMMVPQFNGGILLDMVRDTKARAIILCGFGSGNFPIEGHGVYIAAKEARERDIVVVVCTQVRFGAVEIDSYEAGRQLIDAGVVSAGDMTVETTMIKLKYLLGLEKTADEIRSLIGESIRGEVTRRSRLSKL